VRETLSVSEAKERLSEIVERVADSGDRFVIESRGRPVAAVVRAEELSGLQEEADRPEGLLGAVGILSEEDEEDEEEWEETVSEIYRQRRQTKPRPMPIEHSTDGLIGAMGAWSEMGDDEIDSMVEEIYRQRRLAGPRSE
jgi:prevent-host-death family protein